MIDPTIILWGEESDELDPAATSEIVIPFDEWGEVRSVACDEEVDDPRGFLDDL